MYQNNLQGNAFAASPKCPCVARSRKFLVTWRQNLTQALGSSCVDFNGKAMKHLPRFEQLLLDPERAKELESSICPCAARTQGVRRVRMPQEATNSLVTDGTGEDPGDVCIDDTKCPPPPPPGLTWYASTDEVFYLVRSKCACEEQASQLSQAVA